MTELLNLVKFNEISIVGSGIRFDWLLLVVVFYILIAGRLVFENLCNGYIQEWLHSECLYMASEPHKQFIYLQKGCASFKALLLQRTICT